MRARFILLLIVLAGCPRFHADPLLGAPSDARFIDVDGVHVHYTELGTGPAVVMLHGYGATLDSWATVAPHVAAEGHRVIALDLKGFGWTSRPEGDYGPAAQAQLVWHVLDRLKIVDVAIVAHSWGSSVGLAMAVAQPARVRRVALYDAYVYDDQVPSFFAWAKTAGLGEALFGLYYTERIEDRAPLAFYDERWVTQARVDQFFRRLNTPVDFDREEGAHAANDGRQSRVVGWLCVAYGGFVALLALIPNPAAGRLAFLGCGAIVLGIGCALLRSGRKHDSLAS